MGGLRSPLASTLAMACADPAQVKICSILPQKFLSRLSLKAFEKKGPGPLLEIFCGSTAFFHEAGAWLFQGELHARKPAHAVLRKREWRKPLLLPDQQARATDGPSASNVARRLAGAKELA